MRRGADDDMVEVLLDDVSAPPTGDVDGAHGETPDGASPRRPGPGSGDLAVPGDAPSDEPGRTGRVRGGRSHRRNVVRLAAVMALVAAVVTANVVEQQAESRRRLAIAEMEGLVTSLDSPLQLRWEEPISRGALVVEDLLLVPQDGQAGMPYAAFDLGTGEQRWSVARGPGGVVDWCSGSLARGDDTLAVCWRSDAVDSDTGAAPPGSQRLVGLSIEDGSVLLDEQTDQPTNGYGTVDGDLVSAVLTDDLLTVRRVDPASGEERWRAEVRLEVRGSDGDFRARIEVVDDYVVVRGPTTVVLSVHEGTVLGGWHTTRLTPRDELDDPDGAVVTTTDRGFAVWYEVDDPDGVRSSVGRWFGREGGAGVEIGGRVVEPARTDGSAPEVLLITDGLEGTLGAVDVETGVSRWTSSLRNGQVLMRRDGAAVVVSGDTVMALDLISGVERWAATVEGLRQDGGGVTDGSDVVVLAVQDGTWLMHAVSLDSGAAGWTEIAPTSSVLSEFAYAGADAMRLVEVAGHVILIAQRSVLGLS